MEKCTKWLQPATIKMTSLFLNSFSRISYPMVATESALVILATKKRHILSGKWTNIKKGSSQGFFKKH